MLMKYRLLTASCLAILAMAGTLGAQITSTEIFVTHNWGLNGITTGTTNWDNIVVVDQSGTSYSISFNSTTSTGSGVYGTIVPDGPYVLEYFWFLATVANGITPGHTHTSPIGNPANSEATHGNGPMQNQGIRITRADGAAFSIVSIEYLNAVEPFLIGTSYNQTIGYADLASWTNYGVCEGLILNSQSWRTLYFSPNYTTISMAQSPAAIMTFNSSNSTFAINGTVASYQMTTGSVFSTSSCDPIVGASVNITGSYSGGDLVALSDVTLTPCTVSISVNPNDSLFITNQISISFGQGDYFRLGGDTGAQPLRYRTLGQNGPAITFRNGVGSGLLDSWNSEFGVNGQLMTLVFDLNGSAPLLLSIEKAYTIPQTIRETRFGTNGAGAGVFGAIGFPIFAQIYNLFYVSPTNTTVGSGPFFGMQFGPFQMEQLAMPLFAHPVHVATDAEGNYLWGVPNGTIPPGLVVDYATVELGTSGGLATVVPAKRVTF